MYRAKVTAENIEDVREEVGALDQRDALTVGCETWSFVHEGGQRGWMTVWPDTRRAMIMFGGDSDWGDWDEDNRTITLDVMDERGEPIIYDESGERTDEEC